MTIDDVKQLAANRGGKCLSKEYINVHIKLSWMCSHGHTWDATIGIIKQGGWCRQCLREDRKKEALEEMQEIAKMKGGTCISEEYENANKKLKWRCKDGHEWLATPAHVKNPGSWCPFCAGKAKWTIEQMKELAEKRGGKCLSTTYKNAITKLIWQCSHGHKWKATPSKILKGQWCSHYDCRYQKVSEKLRLNINEIHRIADERGGKLISSEYINSQLPLKWQCEKGHQWTDNVLNVKYNLTWCPICYPSKKDRAEYKILLNKREKERKIN